LTCYWEPELVAQIPAYAQDDHLTIEMPPCKQLLKAAQLAHHPSRLPDTPLYSMGLGDLHQSCEMHAVIAYLDPLLNSYAFDNGKGANIMEMQSYGPAASKMPGFDGH
jgi:hypothetical protein